MYLYITRHREANDPTETFETTFLLKDGMRRVVLPKHLAKCDLETLAKRWFAIHGNGDYDANAAIASIEGTKLVALTRGYIFQSADTVVMAAVEERIKRAVWMIVDDALYHRHLAMTPEQNIEVKLCGKDGPEGKAVPTLLQETIDYMNDK